MANTKHTVLRAVVLAVLVGLPSLAPGFETEAPPQHIPIDPNVFRFIQRHFRDNAIQAETAAYEAVLATSSAGTKSKTKEKTTLRVLQSSIIEEQTDSKMSITVNGQSFPQKVQTVAYSTVNGFIPLGSQTKSQSRYAKTITDSTVIKIDEISGNLFPIAVGNHFAFHIFGHYRTRAEGRVYTGNYSSETSCKVTKKFEANSFHANLRGTAYLVQCSGKTTNNDSPYGSSTVQSNSVYFDALGLSIKADPIDSQPNIIYSSAPVATAGKYRSVTKGAYRLTSFSLRPTLICLHPTFAEEVLLLGQIDGDRSTTDRIAQAIINLRAKYCRLVHEVPKSDAEAEIKKNCFQYTGMFRGERVYWGACYG
jgi:hypothetical protein